MPRKRTVRKRIARARVTRRKSGGYFDSRWEAASRAREAQEKAKKRINTERTKLDKAYTNINNTRRKYFTNGKTVDEISAVNQDWMDEIARLKKSANQTANQNANQTANRIIRDGISDIESKLHQRRMAHISDELLAARKKAKNSKAPGDAAYVDKLKAIRKKFLQQIPTGNRELMDNLAIMKKAAFKDDIDELDKNITELEKEVKTLKEKISFSVPSLNRHLDSMKKSNNDDREDINTELDMIKKDKIRDEFVRVLEEKIKNEKQILEEQILEEKTHNEQILKMEITEPVTLKSPLTAIKLKSMGLLLTDMKAQLGMKGGFWWGPSAKELAESRKDEISKRVDKLIKLYINIQEREKQISETKELMDNYSRRKNEIGVAKLDLQSAINARDKYIQSIN